jgi:hypothetical protein
MVSSSYKAEGFECESEDAMELLSEGRSVVCWGKVGESWDILMILHRWIHGHGLCCGWNVG